MSQPQGQNVPSPQSVAILAAKLYDADSDIRYMSLNDLLTAFNHATSTGFLASDYNQCAKIVDGFMHTLNDPNGEVQNLTIKCLGPFVNKVHPEILCPMIHKVSNLPTDNTFDSSICALATRTIVVSLPRPTSTTPRTKAVEDAYSAISRVLIPRLVGYIVIPRSDKSLPDPPKGLLEEDLENGTDSNFIDVLTEIARCYGPILKPEEVKALQKITMQLLENERTGSVMKKKAVVALSSLAHFFSEQLLSSVITHIIESMTVAHVTHANRRLYITTFGSMARSIPTKFGPHLRTIAPFVIGALSQEELDDQMRGASESDDEPDPMADEVKEAALVTLETFVGSCPDDMYRYHDDTVNALLRFLRYDPNFTENDDYEADDEEGDSNDDEQDFEVDEDFEEEGAADDEDDVSWKVRRCAAKTLHTLISVRSRELLENGATYDRVVLAMLERFAEREETVRLEILATFAFLIRKTGEENTHAINGMVNGLDRSLSAQAQSRKRRRGYSDVVMSDGVKSGRFTGSTSPETRTPPRSGAPASLTNLSPGIVRGTMKLLKTSTLATKQACVLLLKDLVDAQHGGLDEFMPGVMDLLIENLKASGSDTRSTGVAASSTGSASTTSLQLESLQLLAEIAKNHSSKIIHPQIAKLVPVVISTTRSKLSKISCEALATVEQIVKVLTPPRWAASNKGSSAQIEQFLAVITELTTSRSVDLSVRQQALHALGTLLGRTNGSQGAKLVGDAQRAEALEMLYDASRNETTRHAAIKAIDSVATLAPEKSEFDTAWFSKICLELGAQLRKADRSLRGASLIALRSLVAFHNRSRNLDNASSQQLSALLLPLLSSNDLHMLGPVLTILSAMIHAGRGDVINEEFNKQLCTLVASSVASPSLDQICDLVLEVGRSGSGQPLMQVLLKDVGVNGTPAVVGKVIGNLLVSGSGNVGVTTAEFLNELEQTSDDRRKCLALSVLGEVGLKSGSSSSLSPDFFISYFGTDSTEVPLAAAIALGRASAGAGNVKTWTQAILQRMKTNTGDQYLILHSIKELLQYVVNDKDLAPFLGSLWEAALSASRSEDSRTIGAECLANLAMVDPSKFLPLLQVLLSDDAAPTRGISILALRDIFSNADSSYDKDLRPIIVEILTTILRDAEVENRRSALNAFNAAARNKLNLILSYLANLQPLIIDQTYIDTSLLREISMGPFKHKVDDGLEVRKAAYETLYSLLDIAPSRINTTQLYDRVVAGIGDEHSIRLLSILLLNKLMVLSPDETVRRLDEFAEQFQPVLAFKPKENAVRHEIERSEEAKTEVIKVTLALQKAFPGDAGSALAALPRPKWTELLNDIKKDHEALAKKVEKELREKST